MNEPNVKPIRIEATTSVLQEVIDIPEKYDEKDSIKTAGSYDRAILNAQILLEIAEGNSVKTVIDNHKESFFMIIKDKTRYIANLKRQVKLRGIEAIYPSNKGAKATAEYTASNSPFMINPKFQNLFTPLKKSEYEGLRANIIRDEAITHPIVIWNNFIIDGHNRYAISEETGIPFTVETREFDSEIDVIDWIITNQRGRRNLNTTQVNYSIGNAYNLEKEPHGGSHKPKVQPELSLDGISTAARLAEMFEVSESSVKRFGKFAEALNVIGETSKFIKNETLSESIKTNSGEVLHLAKMTPDDILKVEALLKADSKMSLSKAITSISQTTPKARLIAFRFEDSKIFEFFDPTTQSREEMQEEIILALQEYRLTHPIPTPVEIEA
jgi:hypothetical protein